MNTKYNKDRILDNGWKRVILNSIPSCCSKTLRSGITTQEDVAVSTNHKQDSVLTKCSGTKKLDSDLSILSLDHEMNNSDVTPSTSKDEAMTPGKNINIREKYEVQIHKRLYPNSSIESETGYEELRTAPKSYYMQRGTKILSLLWKSFEKEEEYIHYFRQPLNLSDLAKDGIMTHVKKI